MYAVSAVKVGKTREDSWARIASSYYSQRMHVQNPDNGLTSVGASSSAFGIFYERQSQAQNLNDWVQGG